MIPGRHANDVVDLGIDPLQQPAPGPPGSQHHHPRLLPCPGGPQTRLLGPRAEFQQLGQRVGVGDGSWCFVAGFERLF